MRSSTRRTSRFVTACFVTACFGAAFQVIVMGGTGRPAEEAGVLRRGHAV
jgi:hypothetical protein